MRHKSYSIPQRYPGLWAKALGRCDTQLVAEPTAGIVTFTVDNVTEEFFDTQVTAFIAPTLLGLIGASTPALGYGRDLLAKTPTLRSGDPGLEALLEDRRGDLAAMWSYPQISDGLRVHAAEGEVVLGDRRLKAPLLLRLDAACPSRGSTSTPATT